MFSSSSPAADRSFLLMCGLFSCLQSGSLLSVMTRTAKLAMGAIAAARGYAPLLITDKLKDDAHDDDKEY